MQTGGFLLALDVVTTVASISVGYCIRRDGRMVTPKRSCLNLAPGTKSFQEYNPLKMYAID